MAERPWTSKELTLQLKTIIGHHNGLYEKTEKLEKKVDLLIKFQILAFIAGGIVFYLA